MSQRGNTPFQQGEPFCRLNGVDHSNALHRTQGDSQNGTVAERPPLFSRLSPADYSRVYAAARVKEFTRGELLYIEGDTVQQVLLITSGLAKITQLGLSGSEVILRFAVPGDVLGAVSLPSTGRHSTTAQAFRLCRALVWDVAAFKALMDSFPVLSQSLVRLLVEDLLELEERFREVATERVGPRVARQLVRLRQRIGRPVDGTVEIALSREELAQMTGTTLFTVSRLLSAWEARGIVKPRREGVTICDVRALQAIYD